MTSCLRVIVPVVDHLCRDDEITQGGDDVSKDHGHVTSLLEGGKDTSQRASKQQEYSDGGELTSGALLVVTVSLNHLKNK